MAGPPILTGETGLPGNPLETLESRRRASLRVVTGRLAGSCRRGGCIRVVQLAERPSRVRWVGQGCTFRRFSRASGHAPAPQREDCRKVRAHSLGLRRQQAFERIGGLVELRLALGRELAQIDLGVAGRVANFGEQPEGPFDAL